MTMRSLSSSSSSTNASVPSRSTTTYVFVRKETREMLADNFIGLIAEQPLRTWIPTYDDSIGRNHKNGILPNVGNQQIESLIDFLARQCAIIR